MLMTNLKMGEIKVCLFVAVLCFFFHPIMVYFSSFNLNEYSVYKIIITDFRSYPEYMVFLFFIPVLLGIYTSVTFFLISKSISEKLYYAVLWLIVSSIIAVLLSAIFLEIPVYILSWLPLLYVGYTLWKFRLTNSRDQGGQSR